MDGSLKFSPVAKVALVTHVYPDTDALICLWALSQLAVVDGGRVAIEFVRSGERLPTDIEDDYRKDAFTVLYADTGYDIFDQHGRELKGYSSARLVAEYFGVANDPRFKHAIDLANKADNIRLIDPTSIHFVFRGLARKHTNKDTKEVNWESVRKDAFDLLNELSAQWVDHARQIEEFANNKNKFFDRNNFGVSVCILDGAPKQREAAFAQGADVVCFSRYVKPPGGGKRKPYYVVQVNRNADISLRETIGRIRAAEAKKRGFDVSGQDLTTLGRVEGIPGWFLHDSQRILACGTNTHPLEDHEFSMLTHDDLLEVFGWVKFNK